MAAFPGRGCPVHTFLVDGYNLLHAAGFVGSKRAGRLEATRTKMLDWIAAADPVRARAARVRVVFDAQNGTANDGERAYRGAVTVRFAYKQTADDLIESLLAAEPLPAGVAVVSNDGRVREAARRRGAAGWACEAFIDWLATGTAGPGAGAAPRPAPPPEKPDGPVADGEREELLLAFQTPKARRRFTPPV